MAWKGECDNGMKQEKKEESNWRGEGFGGKE